VFDVRYATHGIVFKKTNLFLDNLDEGLSESTAVILGKDRELLKMPRRFLSSFAEG
jgi:hypothetical protein